MLVEPSEKRAIAFVDGQNLFRCARTAFGYTYPNYDVQLLADRLEPAHIHVERDDSAAKVWLDPLEFSFVEGFREHELNEILRITDAHLDEFLRAWYIAFGGRQP